MVQQYVAPAYVIRKLPLYPVLWHIAIGSFIGALVTDLSYWKTAEMTWANFSAWLLAAGLLVGVIAVLTLLLDWIFGRLVGQHRPGFPYLVGIVVVLALAFVNSLIHSRDAWSSVVPQGLGFSAATVLVIVLCGAMQRAKASRYLIGVEA